MIEKITTPQAKEEDNKIEIARPKSFDDFIGQETAKKNMQVYITAAKQRQDVLDHVLLSGPPGLGKTSFAKIIAREMGSNFIETSAPIIEKQGDMASILTSLQEGDILFVDEIHRLKPIIEEVLYSAMEDFSLDIKLGQDTSANVVKITLAKFTLIGATTKPGSLTKPLISRFGILNQFEFYEMSSLKKIVARNLKQINLSADDLAVEEISMRSRGTPRILNRLLKRVRDFAQVLKKESLDKKTIAYALDQLEIDSIGLDKMDRNILTCIAKTFEGGPVGIESIATAIGEDAISLEEFYEPYLIQIGFIKRTSRGRILTSKAYQHLGLKPLTTVEDSLFE